MRQRLTALLLVLGSCTTGAALANDDHKGPHIPKVAIEACASKQEGQACSFLGRQGETVSGVCSSAPPMRPPQEGQGNQQPPQPQQSGNDMPPPPQGEKVMACRPDHPPQGDMPPPQ